MSKKTEDWKWGDRIAIIFENPVWSSTWMKRFYYEKVPASGNLNTVNVAKFAQSLPKGDTALFESKYTPTYRHVVSLGEDYESTRAYYGIDTGQNENPW